MWKYLLVAEFLSRNGDALANDESLELRCLSFQVGYTSHIISVKYLAWSSMAP